MEQPNADLLEEFEQTVNLIPVSPGVRFVNMLIDTICLYAMTFALTFILSLMILLAGPREYDSESFETRDDGAMQMLLLFGGYLYAILFYTLFEYFGKGRTLGKMATGTIAVREDGSRLTFKDAFLRSLCRCIPFEPFSAFGYRPWHDSITRTMVVKKTW